MQCQTCQSDLPPNTTFCTNCGASVGSPSSPNQGVAPTMFAAPPQPGIAPTMFAPTPNQGMPASYPTLPPEPQPYTPYPSTNYGESAPPPPPVNPYTVPPVPAPYGAPQQGQYSAPQVPYGAPQQGQYGAPQPMYVQPQKPKGNRGCLIAVVIVLVLFVLIVGGVSAAGYYVYRQASNAVATVGSNVQTAVPTIDASLSATPNTTNTSSVPDTSQIDATAAANIPSAQTSGSIDSNFLPTDIKSNFNTGDTVNITFTLAGNAGYAMTKIYLNGQFHVQSPTPLTVKSGYTNGAFPFTPSTAGPYVAGIYWCTASDCSDAALAQIVNFTVS